MANSYSSIHIHIIFAVKYREALISPLIRQKVHMYMTKVLTNQGHTVLALNGTDDHVHALIGYNENILLKDTVRELKVATTKFINGNNLTLRSFAWQLGSGRFDASNPEAVAEYIRNQVEHHKHMTFRQEYEKILRRYGVDYDPQYIFTEPE